MIEAILALGTNLGNRAANLRRAIALLEERGVQARRGSNAWETEPVPADQPRYLNAVIAVETNLSPRDLLQAAKEIEGLMGRRPGRRWGPRPIDIDILFYGAQRIAEPDLIIPHERIPERVFVLAPLAEVVKGPLPVLDASAADLLALLGDDSARRTDITLLS